MRTLTMDAALVALPSLGASAASVYAGQMLLERYGDGRWYGHPLALFPLCFLAGGALTWIVYQIVRPLLEHRALSTSRGRSMLVFLAALTAGFGLMYDALLSLALLAAAAGSALTLKLLRERPSRDWPAAVQAEPEPEASCN